MLGCVIIKNMHVVNDYHPLLLEDPYEKVSLLIEVPWDRQWVVGLQVTLQIGLRALHGMTSMD